MQTVCKLTQPICFTAKKLLESMAVEFFWGKKTVDLFYQSTNPNIIAKSKFKNKDTIAPNETFINQNANYNVN